MKAARLHDPTDTAPDPTDQTVAIRVLGRAVASDGCAFTRLLFLESELEILAKASGFYSDLQSMHSEDAITWSVFGPVAYADPSTRKLFVEDLFRQIGPNETVGHANVWLWRRLPHPDKPVSGGPEIDFGAQTESVSSGKPNGARR